MVKNPEITFRGLGPLHLTMVASAHCFSVYPETAANIPRRSQIQGQHKTMTSHHVIPPEAKNVERNAQREM